MTGTVTDDGIPIIMVLVGGEMWPGIVATGFNGDVELPDELRESLNARLIGRISSLLASGQHIEQDVYLVDFPFDGEPVVAEATVVPGEKILIGTQLMQLYRLELHFPDQTVGRRHRGQNGESSLHRLRQQRSGAQGLCA
jgi:predicted aspartyl protease